MENNELIGHILKSTIGVIGRRTSDSYSIVVIRNTLKEIEKSYPFIKYVNIKNIQFTEANDVVEIFDDINSVKKVDVCNSVNSFFRKLTTKMGKDAGFFFIKEIKEDLPLDYEQVLKELGVDLDLLHLEYITERKEIISFEIKNSEVFKHVFKILFDILERQNNRKFAIETLREIVSRFSTEYVILRAIKINDVFQTQNIDLITVEEDADSIEDKDVGIAVQKVLQEINKSLGERGGHFFIEKLKNSIQHNYILRLEELGVNFNVLNLRQDLVIKNVLKALVDVLSEVSTQSYAILVVNKSLRKVEEKFDFLKSVKIDSSRFSEGIDAITTPDSIESVRSSDLGKGIQRILENIVKSLGEKAGKDFIDRFKKRLGNAYLVRIDEMGVNLHMIQLRQNLLF